MAGSGCWAVGCRRRAAAQITSSGPGQVCDDPEELRRKVRELAGAVRSARHLVVYTGAGISTVSEGLRVASGVGRPLLGHKLGLYGAGVQMLAHLCSNFKVSFLGDPNTVLGLRFN